VASASPIQIYKNPLKLLNYDKLSPESSYQLVIGDFKVCPEIRNKNPMNLKNICEIPKVTNVIKRQVDFKKMFFNQKESMFYFKENNMACKLVHINVYTKELNSVVGKAFECIQVRKYKKFTENILLNRFEIEWQEKITLTDLDCKKMVKYKLCGKSRGKMNCDNKVCSFAEGITPEYR